MNIKKYIFAMILLQLTSGLYASDLAQAMTLAANELSNVRITLANLLSEGATAGEVPRENEADKELPTENGTGEEIASESVTDEIATAGEVPSGNEADKELPTENGTGEEITNKSVTDESATAGEVSSENEAGEGEDASLVTLETNTRNEASGDEIGGDEDEVNAGAPREDNVITAITNSTTQIVYLLMFNASNVQINPTTIVLRPGAFSYVPINCNSVKIVNNRDQPLLAQPITMQSNYAYELTNENNMLDVIATPMSQSKALYNYTNSTSVPLVISITIDGSITSVQQLAPQSVYTQAMNPSDMVTIKVHADISPIFRAYNPAVSYNIIIDEAHKLSLEESEGAYQSLMNNSGLPMFVTFSKADGVQTNMILYDGEQYQPEETTTSVTVSCCITNSGSVQAPAKSCSIINKNEQLVLQF